MGKKKNTATQTQTNTYGWQTRPETEDVRALRGMKASVDTNIPYQYAAQRERLENSYQNPLGSYTSPAVREAVSRSAGQRLGMEEAQALQNSQANADSTNYARQAALAGMTAPQLIQTGGTSTGMQTQSGGFLGDLLLGGVA